MDWDPRRVHEEVLLMEPKVIRTEAEYRSYLGEVERLALLDPAPGTQDGEKLELLALLVEEYEKARFKFERPTPIEAIQFRMREQGLRQADLVPYFGSRSRVSEVLSGKRPLTVQMIRDVSAGLGIPADVLLSSTDTHEAGARYEAAELEWQKFPCKEMERHGYFDGIAKRKNQSATELARNFFMRIVDLDAGAPMLARQGLRGDAVTPKSRYAVLAWKVRVLDRARKKRAEHNLPTYQPASLDETFLSQVVHLSWHPNGVKLACELIEGIGIPIVIEPHLAGTHLDGAALLDQDNRPIIALTRRFDRLDYFWFTLLHELVHVLRHLNRPGDSFLDRLEDCEATEKLEIEANRIARDALIARAAWRRAEILSVPSKERILRFAKEQMIHPAIVAGRLRRETGNFKIFGELLGSRELRDQFLEVSY